MNNQAKIEKLKNLKHFPISLEIHSNRTIILKFREHKDNVRRSRERIKEAEQKERDRSASLKKEFTDAMMLANEKKNERNDKNSILMIADGEQNVKDMPKYSEKNWEETKSRWKEGNNIPRAQKPLKATFNPHGENENAFNIQTFNYANNKKPDISQGFVNHDISNTDYSDQHPYEESKISE